VIRTAHDLAGQVQNHDIAIEILFDIQIALLLDGGCFRVLIYDKVQIKGFQPGLSPAGNIFARQRAEQEFAMSKVRQPVLAGAWYPAGPEELATMVEGFLAGADPAFRPAGRPFLALVPHAGYVYSGPTAGKLYGLLRERPPRRLIVLAPNHRAALDRMALSGAEAFATPLGEVRVDRAAVDQLNANESFAINDQAHASEHAIEIQLPLVQRTWPDATPPIVPLLVPRLTDTQRREAAAALAGLADEGTLFLVSTDFTHYGAAYGYVPFTENLPAALEKLDSGAILKILAADAAGLRDYGRSTGITMCGLEATALALDRKLPDGYEGALIDYSRSGDREGDYSLSVSYASLLFCTGTDGSAPDGSDDHGR
jgi:AmmeMemoRadiSam system protein B